MRIRKNDMVMVISGNARGKTGKVLKVFPERQRVIVDRPAMPQPKPSGPLPARLEYVSASSGSMPIRPGGTRIGMR